MVSINIAPLLHQHAGQDDALLRSIGRAAYALSGASVDNTMAHCARAEDFENLRQFLASPNIIISVFFASVPLVIDDKPDVQRSKDGYGVMDWNQL